MCFAEVLTWQWDSEVPRRFQAIWRTYCGGEFFVTSLVLWHLTGWESEVPGTNNIAFEIDCREVRRQLVDYMERDLTAEQRAQIDQHLQKCRHCLAVYDGVRNVVQLVGSEKVFELPEGFSQRLYKRFLERGA